MEKYVLLFFIYLAIINAYGFIICLVDKSFARRHKWRISEQHLILTAILGGAIGVLFGMQLFRHKTKKPKFFITIPLLCVIWIALITFLIYKYSFLINTIKKPYNAI